MGRLGWTVAAVLGAAAVAGVAYAASGGAAKPAIAPCGGPTLAIGTMATQTVTNTSGGGACAPPGAKIFGVSGGTNGDYLSTNLSADGGTVAFTRAPGITIGAGQSMSASVTVSWVDASGNTQTTTIPVTVTN